MGAKPEPEPERETVGKLYRSQLQSTQKLVRHILTTTFGYAERSIDGSANRLSAVEVFAYEGQSKAPGSWVASFEEISTNSGPEFDHLEIKLWPLGVSKTQLKKVLDRIEPTMLPVKGKQSIENILENE